ncbi:hypothetical protein [Mesorhizobium sp. Root552]|uniref:hypothetical protein n=1 Tax=Mesorhizobium sp. Root552 TaxID=1736555 RepID=UPI0039B74565
MLLILGLSGCNSSGVLDPSALGKKPDPTPASQGDMSSRIPSEFGTETTAVRPPASNTPLQASTPTATAPASAPQQTAVASRTRLQIAPIVGATVEAAAPLSEQLQTEARQRGITLAGSTDQSATHVLKGYFSVITEGKETTVIYVWDVYDPGGNRLHRINGQEKAPAVNGAEGWAGVAPATMQAIANKTIDQFSSWLGGRTG